MIMIGGMRVEGRRNGKFTYCYPTDMASRSQTPIPPPPSKSLGFSKDSMERLLLPV
jgi:hypothetical protein